MPPETPDNEEEQDTDRIPSPGGLRGLIEQLADPAGLYKADPSG